MSVWGWVALALGVLNLVVWVAVVLAARRLWRQLRPQVEPLLAMFLPPVNAPEPTPESNDAFLTFARDVLDGDVRE